MANAVKDQGLWNTAKGGVSNAVDLADAMAKQGAGKLKEVTDNLDQKALNAQNAVYKGLKNDAVVPEPGFSRDGDYTLNPSGQYGGEPLFSDDASSLSPSGGVTDPTVPPTPSEEASFQGVSDPTPPPNPSPAKSNFQQSMSQMNYMSQQMQQAGQRMQGQSHIRGAEIDETEE
jgi:hypothetical protein